MKSFFTIFLVICGLAAAVWFLYDPYVRPLLDRITSGPAMVDKNKVVEAEKKTSDPVPVAKASPPPPTTSAPAPAPDLAKPTSAAPSKPKTELDELLELRYPMPEILPLLTIVDHWRNVPPNAYPNEVTAKETVPFELVINGQVAGSSNVAPGTPLKPVRLEGNMLAIASPANPAMNTMVPVDKTDFKQRIEQRYAQFVEMKQKEVEARRERVRKIVRKDPERIALLRGETLPSPDSSDDSRFGIVKQSLERGEVASVRASEATSFRWNGTESISGAFSGTYETVTVTFKVSTIFGVFPIEYKCLIQGGRVVGWVDAVTEDKV